MPDYPLREARAKALTLLQEAAAKSGSTLPEELLQELVDAIARELYEASGGPRFEVHI